MAAAAWLYIFYYSRYSGRGYFDFFFVDGDSLCSVGLRYSLVCLSSGQTLLFLLFILVYSVHFFCSVRWFITGYFLQIFLSCFVYLGILRC